MKLVIKVQGKSNEKETEIESKREIEIEITKERLKKRRGGGREIGRRNVTEEEKRKGKERKIERNESNDAWSMSRTATSHFNFFPMIQN